jgi:hypothetical protein
VPRLGKLSGVRRSTLPAGVKGLHERRKGEAVGADVNKFSPAFTLVAVYSKDQGMMMSDANIDVKLALEEMRINMQQSLDAGDRLDDKLNQIQVGSGAVLALVTTLNLSLSFDQSRLYWAIFLVAVGLYVISVLLALVGTGPKPYHLAIAPEWEELDKEIFGKAERDAILTLLSGYVDQIEHNRKINQSKVNVYRFSLSILPITVILLVTLLIIR